MAPTKLFSCLARPRIIFPPRKVPRRAPFSSTRATLATDPATDLSDTISPSEAPKPDRSPVPSRRPSEPSDTRNPSLQGYADPRTGRLTTSTATPDTTTPATPKTETIFGGNPYAKDSVNSMLNAINYESQEQSARPTQQPSPPTQDRTAYIERKRARRVAELAAGGEVKAVEYQAKQMASLAGRLWREGDAYAPHDLHPVEQTKAREARSPNPRRQAARPPNTRKHGDKDLLDELGIDPVREYKNFALMGEFVTRMGRIRHGKETGLRGVNQRRMAKAVRRAVGIGLHPSVHQHPELLVERREQRGEIAARLGLGR